MRTTLALVGALLLSGISARGQEISAYIQPPAEVAYTPYPTTLTEPGTTTGTRSELPDAPAPILPGRPAIGPKMPGKRSYGGWFPDYLLTATRPQKSKRVADKEFWLLSAATIGTTILASAAVSHCRHTVGVEPCDGGYGGYWPFQIMRLSVSSVMVALGYYAKRDASESWEKTAWWIAPSSSLTYNTITGIQQYRMHCASGTHFNGKECQ